MSSTTPSDASTRVDELDLRLFETVLSQSSPYDRRSLLMLQSAVARGFGSYSYLEIGSYQGGSLQPHVVDGRCRKIYSIDPRPAAAPDNRGPVSDYPENSTRQMLTNLRRLGEGALEKIQSFDSDAAAIPPAEVIDPPQLCFIDGEHTTTAVVSDFRFCHQVCHADGAVAFHDVSVIASALKKIMAELRRERVSFQAGKLPGDVFFIAFGKSPIREDPRVRAAARSPDLFLALQPFLQTGLGGFARRSWWKLRDGLRGKDRGLVAAPKPQ